MPAEYDRHGKIVIYESDSADGMIHGFVASRHLMIVLKENSRALDSIEYKTNLVEIFKYFEVLTATSKDCYKNSSYYGMINS